MRILRVLFGIFFAAASVLFVLLSFEMNDASGRAAMSFVAATLACLSWLCFRGRRNDVAEHALASTNLSPTAKVERLVAQTKDNWPKINSPTETADATEMLAGPTQEADNLTKGMRFGLSYSDAFGNESSRAIRLISVGRLGTNLYLNGFCELRKENRTFRVDRILEIYDLSTGEIIDSPANYFSRLSNARRSTNEYAVGNQGGNVQILEKMSDELRLLCVVARADGKISRAERDVMKKYATMRALDFEKTIPTGFVEGVDDWLKYQSPAAGQVAEILTSIRTQQPELMIFLWAVAGAVAAADKKFGQAEKAIVDAIKNAVQLDI